MHKINVFKPAYSFNQNAQVMHLSRFHELCFINLYTIVNRQWNFFGRGTSLMWAHLKLKWTFLFFRAINNELLDTYQLKSLDGLVEGRLEDIAIVRREKDGLRRRMAKKRSQKSTEGKEQLYLTLTELLDQNGNNISKITGQNLPGFHTDNFSLRQPYDRVIRCLGFRFNFSIFDG